MKLLYNCIILVFLLVFLTPFLSNAQSGLMIKGTVLDASTSEPIAGANAYIPELNRGAATNSNGVFTISSVPAGSYTLEISFLGFQIKTRSITVLNNGPVELIVELSPFGILMEGIVVTSLRPDLETDAQLGQEQIRKANPRDSGELLRSVNGVDAVRRGSIGLDPVIRGLRETEVGTYLDGTRIFPAGPARMDSPLSHLDPMMIESIEVVKGPYALNWGAGNMSAIRVQTKSLQSINTPFGGRLIGGYDSNFNTIESGLYLYGRTGRTGYLISGARRTGSDYNSGNGTSIPGNYLSQEIRGKFDIKTGSASNLTLSLGYQYQDDIDYPGRLLDADFFETTNAMAAWEWRPENKLISNFNAKAYLNNVSHGMDNDSKPTGQPNPERMPPFALDVTVDTKNYVYGGQIAAILNTDDQWEWEIGGDIYSSFRDATRSVKRRDNGNELFFDLMWPDANITDLGIYNRLSRSFSDRLSATTSLRVDIVSASTDTISQFFVDNVSTDLDNRETNVSASTTLNYSLSEIWTIGFGLGTVVRTADATERYSDRIPASKAQTSAEFVGNPGLEPERSTQSDLWIDAAYKNLTLSINGFLRQMDQYITLSPTDLPKRLPLSPDTVFRYINGSAQFAGFDVSLNYRFLDQWRAMGELSYLYGEDTELDEPALGVSPLSGSAGLRYDFAEIPLFLESMFQFVSSQDRVSSVRGEQSTDGYTLAYFQGGWSVTRNVSLQFGVKNLFDKQYLNHLNARNPFTSAPIAEPGRVIFGDLSIRF